MKLIGSKISDRSDNKIIEFNLLKRIDKFSMVILALVGVLAIIGTGVFDYTLSYGNITVNYADAPVDWADNLYLPIGTDRGLLNNTDVVSDKESGTVTLPVLAYENVTVYDESGTRLEWTPGDNNCIQVEYDGDASNLTTSFIEPMLWRVAEAVSVICVLALIVYTRKAEV